MAKKKKNEQEPPRTRIYLAPGVDAILTIGEYALVNEHGDISILTVERSRENPAALWYFIREGKYRKGHYLYNFSLGFESCENLPRSFIENSLLASLVADADPHFDALES